MSGGDEQCFAVDPLFAEKRCVQTFGHIGRHTYTETTMSNDRPTTAKKPRAPRAPKVLSPAAFAEVVHATCAKFSEREMRVYSAVLEALDESAKAGV